MSVTVEVVNVFARADGSGGNQLGFVRDGKSLTPGERQGIAAQLGYSETVFAVGSDRLVIHTPTTELPFAGHPIVGAAWLMRRSPLHPPAGAVTTRVDGDFAFIQAPASFSPAWDSRQLARPEDVDALDAPPTGNVQWWAWRDEATGMIRARVFAGDYGVAEDPATGSATLALCARLGRAITVDQGPGSEIHARPLDDGLVELSGRVLAEGIVTV